MAIRAIATGFVPVPFGRLPASYTSRQVYTAVLTSQHGLAHIVALTRSLLQCLKVLDLSAMSVNAPLVGITVRVVPTRLGLSFTETYPLVDNSAFMMTEAGSVSTIPTLLGLKGFTVSILSAASEGAPSSTLGWIAHVLEAFVTSTALLVSQAQFILLQISDSMGGTQVH